MRLWSSEVERLSMLEDPEPGTGVAPGCEVAGMRRVGLLRTAQGEGGQSPCG